MRPRRHAAVLPVFYFWALPNTVIGLALGLASLATGGRAQIRLGTIEFHGGAASWLLRRVCRAWAMTLGHVVVGLTPEALDLCRAHEQEHVRQAELWGPLFLPAYIAASLWEWLRRRDYYWDNYFEREARRLSEWP